VPTARSRALVRGLLSLEEIKKKSKTKKNKTKQNKKKGDGEGERFKSDGRKGRKDTFSVTSRVVILNERFVLLGVPGQPHSVPLAVS
jgi:hypothetical protein